MAFIAPRVSRRERVRNPILAGVGDALQGIPAILQMMQFMEMQQGREDREQARFEQEEEDRREAEIAAGLAGPLGERDLEAYLRAVERLDLTPEEQRQVDLDFPTEQQWDIGAADAIAARLGDNLPFVEPEYLSQLAAEAGGRGPTIGLSDVLHGAPVPGDLSPDPVAGITPEDMALTGLGATTSALPEASIDPTAESDWADILSGGGLERLTEQTELDPSMGPVELGDPRLGIGDHLAQLQGATKRRMEFIPPLERAGIEASIRADEGRRAGYDLEKFLAQTAADEAGEERKLRMIMSDREHEAQMAQYAQATKFGIMEFDANQAERAERISLDRQRFETEMARAIREENRDIRAHDLNVIVTEEQTKVAALERQKAEREAAGVFDPKEMLLYDLEYKTAVRNLKLVEVQLALARGELTPLQAERQRAEINLLEAQAEDLRRGSGIAALLGTGEGAGGQGDPTSPSVYLNDPDDPEQNVTSYRLSPDGPGLYTSTGGEDQEPRRGIDIAHEQLGSLIQEADELRGQFPEESEELLERLAAQVREADFEARASEGPVPERAEHLLESPHREDEVDPVSVARRQMGRLSGTQQRVSPKLAQLESTIDQLASQLGVDKQALEAFIRSSTEQRQTDVAKYSPYEPGGWSLMRMLTGQ